MLAMCYRIYALKLKDSNEIRYVGRTSESLEIRLSKHKLNAKVDKKKTHRHYWILKNYDNIEIIIIEDNIPTFEESCEKEIQYIREYREIYNLVNMTDGGDGGCPGYKHTEEAKKKISEANKGKKVSEKTKELLRNRVISEETKRKLSESSKKTTKGELNPMYGKKRPDTIELNKKRTGWKHKDEVRKKMSEDRQGENGSNYKHGRYSKKYKEEHKRVYKLNESDVIEIRKLHSEGMSYKEIATIYDTSQQYISAIVRRINWRSVE